MNYLGGKSRLAKQIATTFPSHLAYVEPFCGACWVLLAKPPSKAEIINDLDGELINFWRCVRLHHDELIRTLQFTFHSRAHFYQLRDIDPATLTDIQRAARYYTIQKGCFGGRNTRPTFGTSSTGPSNFNPHHIHQSFATMANRMARITIENLDANTCIKKYDRTTTLFYVDPPYYNTAGYAIPYTDQDYHHLHQTLSTIKGRFVLSINDHRYLTPIPSNPSPSAIPAPTPAPHQPPKQSSKTNSSSVIFKAILAS